MTEQPFTPRHFVRLGRLAGALEMASDDLLDGLEASPAEVSALDQVLAEAGELEPGYSAMSLDEIIEDAEAEAALQELEAETGDGPGPRLQPHDREFALELANVVAETGDIDGAAELYAAIGGASTGHAVDLANADYSGVIEMSNAVFGQAATVAAEDAVSLPRSTEARLAHLLGRVSRNTYQPAAALQFASPGTAARELARRRWQISQPGPVTGRENCGASDDFGYCVEPMHAMGCGSLATTETASALRDSGSYARLAAQPLADANDRAWTDQFGEPITMRGHVEALTGQRLGGGAAFETGRPKREVTTPGRLPVFGDVDDPDDPGTRLPGVSAVAAQMGLAGTAAAHRQREAHRAEHDRRVADRALRSGGRVTHPDLAESTRERAARLHQRATMRQVDQPADGLAGALPQYTAG